MDWLTFVASLVDSLAWPGGIALVLIAYRRVIGDRIKAIRRFKYQDVEVSLGSEVEQVAAQIEAAVPRERQLPATRSVTPSAPEWRVQVEAVARVAPSAAYVLAWSHLEAELAKTSAAVGLPVSTSGSPRSMISALLHRQVLDAEEADVLAHLRNIRNKAAHRPMEVSEAEADAAREYAELVERMILYLQRVRSRTGTLAASDA